MLAQVVQDIVKLEIPYAGLSFCENRYSFLGRRYADPNILGAEFSVNPSFGFEFDTPYAHPRIL